LALKILRNNVQLGWQEVDRTERVGRAQGRHRGGTLILVLGKHVDYHIYLSTIFGNVWNITAIVTKDLENKNPVLCIRITAKNIEADINFIDLINTSCYPSRAYHKDLPKKGRLPSLTRFDPRLCSPTDAIKRESSLRTGKNLIRHSKLGCSLRIRKLPVELYK
jgi:hypothetical protein